MPDTLADRLRELAGTLRATDDAALLREAADALDAAGAREAKLAAAVECLHANAEWRRAHGAKIIAAQEEMYATFRRHGWDGNVYEWPSWLNDLNLAALAAARGEGVGE